MVAPAVKVTLVPEQMLLVPAVMLTDGITLFETDIVTTLLVTILVVTHPALLVICKLKTSLFAMPLVV